MHLEPAGTNLALKRRVFFQNTILRRSVNTYIAYHRHIADLSLFPFSIIFHTRVFLFTIYVFQERLVALHPQLQTLLTLSYRPHRLRTTCAHQLTLKLRSALVHHRDLVNGLDSSDEEDEEEVRRRLRYSRWSVWRDGDDTATHKAALGLVGYRMQDSIESQDRTVEGLIHARSERVMSARIVTNRVRRSRLGSLPPIPFTISPQSLSSNALLSPTTLPISPSFGGTNERHIHR